MKTDVVHTIKLGRIISEHSSHSFDCAWIEPKPLLSDVNDEKPARTALMVRLHADQINGKFCFRLRRELCWRVLEAGTVRLKRSKFRKLHRHFTKRRRNRKVDVRFLILDGLAEWRQ